MNVRSSGVFQISAQVLPTSFATSPFTVNFAYFPLGICFTAKLFSFASSAKEKKGEAAEAKKKIETTKEVDEVDQDFGAYSKYKEQYDNTFDYISGSVMMGLDASAVAKDSIVYRISSEDAVDIAKSLESSRCCF